MQRQPSHPSTMMHCHQSGATWFGLAALGSTWQSAGQAIPSAVWVCATVGVVAASTELASPASSTSRMSLICEGTTRRDGVKYAGTANMVSDLEQLLLLFQTPGATKEAQEEPLMPVMIWPVDFTLIVCLLDINIIMNMLCGGGAHNVKGTLSILVFTCDASLACKLLSMLG